MKKLLRTVTAAILLFSTSARAQIDRRSSAYFAIDSVYVQLAHWRTQSADQDTLSPEQYVLKYFSVVNDTLYANIPPGYSEYQIDNPIGGGRVQNKNMVTVYQGTFSYFYSLGNLLGSNVAICNVKKKTMIIMSL